MTGTAKRIIGYSIVGAAVAGFFFAARQPIIDYTAQVITFVKEYSYAHDDLLQELRQEIFAQPLRRVGPTRAASLSPTKIIELTNNERTDRGLYALTENRLLNEAANRKLRDMFDRQYFEHISPDGRGPGYLATEAGYVYVVVGENLALGTFTSDQDLVEAWMNSLGHRENILNKRYFEIGVAVGNGTFKGERVWLAVQEFGKPQTACPSVPTVLKTEIDKDKASVAGMAADLTERRKALDTMPHGTPEESRLYNAKVSEYNDAVNNYNDSLANLKKQIDEYNQAVRDFNACARE